MYKKYDTTLSHSISIPNTQKGNGFFYGCCILAVLVILVEGFEAFSYDIWVDEAFSLRMIEHSWLDIINLTAMDVHPPLYYFILKLGSGIIHNTLGIPSIICAKLVSVIPILILLAISVLYIRPRFGNYVTGLFLLCLVAAPNLTSYSVDIRMYGWGLLFVTVTWQIAFSLLDDGLDGSNYCKRLFILIVGTLLAAYTHYFALVAVAFAWLMLLVKQLLTQQYYLLKLLLCAGFISLLVYIPWLFVLFNQIKNVKESYWIPQISFETIIHYIQFAFGNGLWIVLFAISVIFFLSSRKVSSSQKHLLIWSVSAAIGTVCFGVIASIVIRPVFVDRYMVPSLGCLWFGFSLALGSNFHSAHKHINSILCAILMTLNVTNFIQQENIARVNSNALYHALDFSDNAVYIVEDARARNILAALTGRLCYQYGAEVDSLTRLVYTNVDCLASLDNVSELIQEGKNVYLVESASKVDHITSYQFATSGLKQNFLGNFFIENTVAKQEINIYELILADL